MILRANSEAELAGAISHVLGHLAGWGLEPVGAVGQIPLVLDASGCLREGRGLAVSRGLSQRQTTVETKADEVGLGYLAKSGYDPAGLADFYERMLAAPEPAPFQPWLVFPESTRARAAQLRAGGRDWVVTTTEFRDVQQRLKTLR